MTYTHMFHEAGNGFPGVGDEVISDEDGGICNDIRLLKVVGMSRIHTRQWHANYVYLVCEPADRDWDDLSESKQDRLYDTLHHVSRLDREDDEQDDADLPAEELT